MEYRKVKAAIVMAFGTQADFAAALGTDEARVSRAVRGRRKLKREEAARWVDLLGCDPALLRPVCREN